MNKKFKLCFLYLSCIACYTQSPYALAANNSDLALKGQVGVKQKNINDLQVNNDGSIVLGGNKNNVQQKEVILSGSNTEPKKPDNNSVISSESNKKIELPFNDKENVDQDSKTNVNGEIPTDFSGGIGKPFYGTTGVLTFGGSNYQKKEKSKNQTNNNDKSASSIPLPSLPPEIKLDKIPIKLNDMPIPKGLPPLPTENGNVMLPISLPTSKAVSLPPLPDFFVPNLGVSFGTTDQGGINNNGVPVDPNGKPINYNGINSIFQSEKNKALSDDFIKSMKNAADKFLSIGLPMRVVVVDTEDFELRRFIATNILRANSNNFESIDTGLTAILSLNTKMNNNIVPVCYVVLKNDQQKDLMDKYIYPLSKISDMDSIAAYLVAHEVTHCMDNLERYKVLPKSTTWFPDTAKSIGLSADAVRRLYPYGMTYNQYSRTVMHLYEDLAQRQYQQRIADIFGLYLTLFSGYDPKIADGVIKLRQGLESSSSYNTYDAIKNIKMDYSNTTKSNIKTLWDSARQLQENKDVDPSLRFGAPETVYSALLNKKSQQSESSITEEFKEDKIKNNKKQTDPKKPVSFDSVQKFGGDNFGGKYFGTSGDKTDYTP